jgi:hypothetical protein
LKVGRDPDLGIIQSRRCLEPESGVNLSVQQARGRYHLFRLPTSIEERLPEVCKDPSVAAEVCAVLEGSEESLLAWLKSLATNDLDKAAQGPILLGRVDKILGGKTLAKIAACYVGSFSGGPRTYPYFEETP